ncbi:MAG: hypothetical protein R3A51_07855 [Nannocystaceae bacterium]
MLEAAAGRYPTQAEIAMLTSWAATLDARVAAVAELAQSEEKIVTLAADGILRGAPEQRRRGADTPEKTARDLALVLRHCAHALLRDDAHYLDATLLVWLRSVLLGLGFTPEFLASSYRLLQRAVDESVSARAAKLVRPYLEQCVRTLGATEAEGAA